MKSLFILLSAAFFAVAAHADTFMGDRNEVDVIFGATSEKSVTAQVRMNEALTNIFGFNGYSDIGVGFSNIEYLSLNVRLVLANATWSTEVNGVETDSTKLKVFLVLPFLGDFRAKPGLNDMSADEFGSNLSTDASYGGIGVQLVKDITPYIRAAVRGNVAHRMTAEMLPEGHYTEEGARLMNRRGDGTLNVNVIDASGVKYELELQAEILRKLLVSLRATASKLNQHATEYFDNEGQANVKYQLHRDGNFRFNLYGDYYVRVTNLTDRGDERTYQLLTGGVNLNW